MSHLSTTVRVEAPAEVVYDIVADPSRGPGMADAPRPRWARSPGGRAASDRATSATTASPGRRLEGRFVVTAAERPTLHQAAGTTRGGWARWTTMIEPRTTARRRRCGSSLEYELPGEIVGSLFGMLTGNRLEGEFKKTYLNLKRLAEIGAGRAAGRRAGGRRPPRRRPGGGAAA